MRMHFEFGGLSEKWQTVAGRTAGLLIALASLAGCGSDSGSTPQSPTSPTPSQPPTAGPSAVRITGIDIIQGRLSLDWARVAGAERYVVEGGSSSGASDLTALSINAPAVVATWQDVSPRSEIYLRVKAANAAGMGPPSGEVRVEMPDVRNVIEALFLSSGPYGEGRRGGASRMTGYAAGSRVSVRVPHEVGGEQFDAVARTVNDLNAAIGAITLFIERASPTRDEWNRLRPPGVTILAGQGACVQVDSTSASCAMNDPVPVYERSLILMPSLAARPREWPHELGHAVGLRHLLLRVRVDSPVAPNVFNQYVPIMGALLVDQNDVGFSPGGTFERFSELELEAIRRVYASGLRPGSTVADFLARNLIAP